MARQHGAPKSTEESVQPTLLLPPPRAAVLARRLGLRVEEETARSSCWSCDALWSLTGPFEGKACVRGGPGPAVMSFSGPSIRPWESVGWVRVVALDNDGPRGPLGESLGWPRVPPGSLVWLKRIEYRSSDALVEF